MKQQLVAAILGLATVDTPRLLTLSATSELAERFGVTRKEVEITALGQHVAPARYHRNLGTIGWEGQLALLHSAVGIAGLGGLGGYVLEGLARMGVGRIIAVDRDCFEDSNLNRQMLCTEDDLGLLKTVAAAKRVRRVNSQVEIITYAVTIGESDLASLFQGADVIVDALDTVPARLTLEDVARRLGAPLVHGAIAGFCAQVMTIFPGDPGLKMVFGGRGAVERGAETVLGNPAATPMLCAALQIQEVVKVITGIGQPIRNRLLYFDSSDGSVENLKLAAE